jgi:hypothetical protein
MSRQHRVLMFALLAVAATWMTWPAKASAMRLDGQPSDTGWMTVDANGRFAFVVPSDMEISPVQGVDSYVREYRNSRCILHFDYGAYEVRFSEQQQPDYRQESTTIGGRAAALTTATDPGQRDGLTFFAGVAFVDVGAGTNFLGRPTRLTMWANSATLEAQGTALSIFQSISFPQQSSQ